MRISIAVWDPFDKRFKDSDEFMIAQVQTSHYNDADLAAMTGVQSGDKMTITLVRKSDGKEFMEWIRQRKQ